MNDFASVELFDKQLRVFSPAHSVVPRALALYSAAIAISDESVLQSAVSKALELGASADKIYEILLQSYLFLGFPRMLIAAENCKDVLTATRTDYRIVDYENFDYDAFQKRGLSLCRRVYAGNFDKLKSKILSMSPEIFQWMILEGYGKVLSRTELDMKTRELAIVACLMIDNKPRQLHSHIRGALNIGVETKLIKSVIEDIGIAAGGGYDNAESIMKDMDKNA